MYDSNGKEKKAIKIDGIGVMGDQIVMDSEGKTVYLVLCPR